MTDAKVQIESSVAASNQSDDKSTGATKSTIVLNDNPNTENGDTTISPVRVVLLGILLLFIGTMGFYYLPGMIATNAKGSKLVNAIYCSVITLTTYVFILRMSGYLKYEHHLTKWSNLVLQSHDFVELVLYVYNHFSCNCYHFQTDTLNEIIVKCRVIYVLVVI